MPSILMLGLVGIVIILGVFMTIGDKKDPISRLAVVIGIVLIVMIVLNFSTFNHLVLSWMEKYPFFRTLVEAK
ncbi:hypothetical protein [Dictyobacter kobayashii]|uniref:Uncharacterized protein n=1 Tax=Dictyobacter kobayashii TaxID=2014872 RepID=A0A402AHS9_9CHLR|nr:hypothetical protein [Dictyobacter kobayashii]GCE18681.1 hypothetical protein KDK_24810 [Dictyobacter kobayashii]